MVIGTDPKTIANVPDAVCDGTCFFLKTTSGDEAYISFKGVQPSAVDHHIILTDDIPAIELPGIIPGLIQARGSVSTTAIDSFVAYS